MMTRDLVGLASVCACALWFAACAAPLRDPRGMAIARGESAPPSRAPASFQADLIVSPRAPGAPPFSARLYGEARGDSSGGSSAAPSRRYRLDVFGFPSSVAASWLWDDGRWLLVRHDLREAVSGEGVALGTEDPSVRIPDVRAVLGVFAGDPLPGYPGAGAPVSDAPGVVRWEFGGETWRARIDSATGLCREVWTSSLALRFARHRLRDGIVIPDETGVVSEGDSLLSLVVRDWKSSPTWKKSPFALVVPPGYERK